MKDTRRVADVVRESNCGRSFVDLLSDDFSCYAANVCWIRALMSGALAGQSHRGRALVASSAFLCLVAILNMRIGQEQKD